MKQERKKLVEFGRKLYEMGLTSGSGGNLSIYNPEKQQIAITPSGIGYFELTEEDIQIVDIDGNQINGSLKPSSELFMHLDVYKYRPEFTAMIHSHPTYSCVLSVLRQPLVAVDYLVAGAGGKDIKVAEYATFGTKELSENALEAMKDRKAVILANHGINVCGESIEEAFNLLETLEFCSKLQVLAQSAGTPVILDDDEMARNVEKFKTYGQK